MMCSLKKNCLISFIKSQVQTMIKTVIKRDGTEEPFQIKKPANWQEWGTNGKVAWTPIFEKVVARLGEKETSRAIQLAFIDEFLALKTWEGNLAAGRLYATVVMKDYYPDGVPTVEQLHNTLQEKGFMKDLGFTSEEYKEVEKIIKHEQDFNLAHFQIKQTTEKYAIQDRHNKIKYETPQFVDMRLAMAMAENEQGTKKIEEVKSFYYHFSNNLVNNPTPNYMYVGTSRSSSPSCCVYVMGDTIDSISAAHHIAEIMASGGAGLGMVTKVRSAGERIRGGELTHMGKKKYVESHSKLASENTAAGRSGALNTGFSVYDPDFNYMIMAQNPRTPISARNRNSHITVQDNKFFAKLVANNEEFVSWTSNSAPLLWDAFVSGDETRFENEYKKYAQTNTTMPRFNAREVLLKWKNQWNQVGTVYGCDVGELNRHTPFRDSINCTNLCTEIALANHEYENIEQLYKTEFFGTGNVVIEDASTISTIDIDLNKKYKKIRHGLSRVVDGGCLLTGDIVVVDNREVKILDIYTPQQPETALCNLSGIILNNFLDKTDEDYYQACLVALKSIDYTIHSTKYKIPHIGWTAKNRLNAGVGIMGLATWLAKKNLHYDTLAGRSEIHRVMERHMYFLIKASIQLGRERGNAPWIDRTKWVDGWTPIKTYNRNIDKYHNAELVYDWDALSQELIDNGGMRFSSLFTIPPGESSSKKSGPPNSIYAIRQFALKKSDASNIIDWVAPFAEELRWNYQSAYNIDTLDMILVYGIANKFTDQTISADFHRDRRSTLELSSDKLITEYLLMKEVGVPTHYYGNSLVSSEDDEESGLMNTGAACGSEGCTL